MISNYRKNFKYKHRVTISRNGLLFILLTSIGLVHQAGIFGGYYLTAIITSFFLFLMALIKFFSNGKKKSTMIKRIRSVGFSLITPWIIFIIFNVIIYATGHGHNEFIKSSFIQIMFTPIILLGALGSYYIYKGNTLRYFLYAIFIQYVIVLIYQFLRLGPIEFISGSFSLFIDRGMTNPFETNSDVVLALGLLLIYYSDNFIKNRTGEQTHLVLVAVLVLLGGKRIEVLAIVAIIASSLATKMMIEKKRNRMQFIISMVIALLLYFFVFIVVSGVLSAFVFAHGINTMGRIKMWDYIAQFSSFSPSFMGNGYSYSNLKLEVERVWVWQGHTYGLHSDVLKVYFDLGFAMFTFWIVYNLFYLPKKVRNQYGFKVGNLFWFLTIYLFILYVTDNCINYYATQMLYVFIILRSIELDSEPVFTKIGMS